MSNYCCWAPNCAVVVADADSSGVAGDDFEVDDDVAFAVPEVGATGAGAAGVAWVVDRGRSKSRRTAARDAVASSRAGYLL